MKTKKSISVIAVLLCCTALALAGCDDILTIGDSWTVLYHAEVAKLMQGKVVTTKSQGGWTAELARQVLPGWVYQHRNADAAFILLGGADFIDKWALWVEAGCPEAGETTPPTDECTELPCPIPAPDDPIAMEWTEQILDDLTAIGNTVKAQGMVPIFGSYSLFPPVQECGQEYYFCEQDLANIQANLIELARRLEIIAAENGFEFLDMVGLHQENCCCYMDPIHPCPPGTPGVVSGTQMVAEKWCEKYVEVFGPQPNITCVFEGEPCTDQQPPECGASKAVGASVFAGESLSF